MRHNEEIRATLLFKIIQHCNMWADGQRLHNGLYRIESTLGRGGFGITYKALHTNLEQYVVIKTPDETLKFDPNYPKFVERFIKEGRLLARLWAEPHPHIVRVTDLFEEGDTHCLVMDFIPGESLWQWVQRYDRLSEAEAVEYIRQIGSALQVVHEAGMVHLDVTPPNIMLKDNGKAVLIDFGIAGEMAPPSSFSRSFGNKAFAPYELYRRGSRHPTVDVYCLAASLYYAVTGQCPTKSFDRKYDGEELVPPQRWFGGISDRLNQAILQGMALEAKDRPQSIEAWLELLTPSESDTDDLSSDVGVDYRRLRDLLNFGEIVGWRVNQEWQTYSEFTFNKNANEGHLPCVWGLWEEVNGLGLWGECEEGHLFSRVETCRV